MAKVPIGFWSRKFLRMESRRIIVANDPVRTYFGVGKERKGGKGGCS